MVELWAVNREYVDMWHEIPRPPSGFMPASIPISEIKAYCEFFGINDIDERRRVLKRIRIIDKEFLIAMQKKREESK